MPKTALHEVVQKVQSRQITETETSQFFRLAPNPAKPLDFNITFNPDTVDMTNAPSAHAMAAPLLRDAGVALQFKRLPTGRPQRPAGFRRKLPLIAEGDSWFKLPDIHPVTPHTLVDLLEPTFATVNLAHWGDTLAEMIGQGQFWSFLKSGQADVLLFSGGGNDVLGGGELWRLIDLFDVDHADPRDAGYYLNAAFYDNLKTVLGNYEGLIKSIKQMTPHVIVLGHGYDYAIPRADGPWIGGPLTRQGIDPAARPALAQAIVKLMLDRFNNGLKAIEKAYPANFKFVDLRGTLADGDWWDELHPFEGGAAKTSSRFAAALLTLPQSEPMPASPFEEHFGRLVA